MAARAAQQKEMMMQKMRDTLKERLEKENLALQDKLKQE